MKLLGIILLLLSACEGTFDLSQTNFEDSQIEDDDQSIVKTNSNNGQLNPTQTNQEKDGAALYAQHCASCHGADAKGNAIWESSIEAYEPIEKIVLEGRGDMGAIAITKKENAKIQEFLLTLGTKTEDLDGPALYSRYCASCHGADAKGAAKWPHSIEAYSPIENIVLKGRDTMDAIPITAKQSGKIQEWLLTLAPATTELDGPGLYSRYCASCHGADAKGAAKWPHSIEGYSPIQSIVLNGRDTMDAISINATQSGKIQDWLLTLAPPVSQLDGKGLYDRFCASCHGADATGTAKWKGSIQAFDPIASIVNNGRGTMDAVPLAAKQVEDIQVYLNTLAPPLSSLNGPQVYARLCVGCHGDKGEGDPKGMQIRYDDLEYSRYWIRKGRGKTLNYASPMPAYDKATISDQQIDEMFAEIDSVAHPTDGKGLYDQYCANCHAADGSGGPARENIRGEIDDFWKKTRKGKGGSQYGRRSKYMSRWDSSQISNAEIDKMIDFASGGF